MFFSMDVAEVPKDLTTACNVHVHMYCTFHCPKLHSAHRSAPSESRISLGQQNENSAAAQPLTGIKRHTPVKCGSVPVKNMSNKPPACCPRGRGQEAD